MHLSRGALASARRQRRSDGASGCQRLSHGARAGVTLRRPADRLLLGPWPPQHVAARPDRTRSPSSAPAPRSPASVGARVPRSSPCTRAWPTVVTYDRRGFGETPRSTERFTHAEDLLAVLDALADGPVWLAGTSAGGGVALEVAIVAPRRVAGLLLLAPGVPGAPVPELDPDTAGLDRRLDEAAASGDLDEVNRLETWLWLDGPSQPEGRVTGPTRALALEMNRIALANEDPGEDAGKSGVDAWQRAGEVTVPTFVAYGELDVPFLVERCHELVRRMPNAALRTIEGAAHLTELERPDAVAALVLDLLARS
jgi:pimeloyl-ACP methyl ester carboxylesterase